MNFEFVLRANLAMRLFVGGCVLLATLPAFGREQKNGTDKLLALHTFDAKSYTFYRGAGREPLELRSQPVYVWLNPTREQGQQGAVFVWTRTGRAEVIGSIFSHPAESGERKVMHEFHTLSTAKLAVESPGSQKWEPQAGLDLKPVPGAPPPASSSRQRAIQLKGLGREFSAHSVDYDKHTWELRLLPQPLYRYEQESEDVLDGAVLAFVTNAGTDPEIIVVLEVRKTAQGAAWHYGLGRFSDFGLYVSHKGKEVWSAVRDEQNPWDHDAKHRYHLHANRFLPEIVESSP